LINVFELGKPNERNNMSSGIKTLNFQDDKPVVNLTKNSKGLEKDKKINYDNEKTYGGKDYENLTNSEKKA
jgi:hypothetical protein